MCALTLFCAAAAAQQQSVVSSPHVAGLTCNPAAKQHSVVVGFSVQPSIPGSAYQWTFSGCGAMPGFYDGQPLSNFMWNGNPNNPLHWKTGVASYNLPAPSDHQPGYNYHARFTDYIGFRNWHSTVPRPLSGGTAVLTFYHEYYAAAQSVSLTAFGIFVGGFTARCFTDGTTHTGG